MVLQPLARARSLSSDNSRVLAMLPEGEVFGAGYFDDSGDIPDHPLLFFSLRGRLDTSRGLISLNKAYEHFPATEGFLVHYEGAIFREEGQIWQRGSWINPLGILPCIDREASPTARIPPSCKAVSPRPWFYVAIAPPLLAPGNSGILEGRLDCEGGAV